MISNQAIKISSDISAADDDSIEIKIQPENKELTTYTEFDIKYEEDDRKIILYIELDPKSITALTRESSKLTFNDERKFIKNSIFFKKIETPESHIKGNFHITFLFYKGLSFNIYFNKKNQQEEADQLFARLKMHYRLVEKWMTKWVNCNIEQSTYSFQISASEVEKILGENLLLEIYFEKYPKPSNKFIGLLNEGNTCYMNSTLQVLFHFMPFRKMIIEKQPSKSHKLVQTLQEIFVEMYTSKSAVNPQELLRCFQRFNEYPRRQQDIHEFLLSFFDDFEVECPEAKHFWSGKDYEVTYSKEKDYESKQEQNYNELQIFMANSLGNHFKTIQQSLRDLIKEEKVDETIETDEFGKLHVYKARYFQSLPPLLFMNVKRYEYNTKRKQLKKINLDLTYPGSINLDFMMKTPGQNLDYILYSIVVHKGKSPNSGHYFTFVNVSKNVNEPDWFQFNDSIVRSCTNEKVLKNYTGQKKPEIHMNEKYGKWVERLEPSEETAYLLAYIRKDLFEEFQNVSIQMPAWHLQKIQQKLTLEESKTKCAVKIYALANDADFDPFSTKLELQDVKFNKNETVEEETKKIESFLPCSVGTVWKVNRKTKTVKFTGKNYDEKCKVTVGKHLECKRGVRIPDYFLVVPSSKTIGLDDLSNICLLHIREVNEIETNDRVEIVAKSEVPNILVQFQKNGANLQYDKQQLEYFSLDWTDYLYVKKE